MMLMAPIACLAACNSQPDRYSEARDLISANCGSCHVVPGVRTAVGRVGPSLADIADQQIIAGKYANAPETMIRWIMHPQQMVPGSAMPEMGLSQKQAGAIAAYLYTLDGAS